METTILTPFEQLDKQYIFYKDLLTLGKLISLPAHLTDMKKSKAAQPQKLVVTPEGELFVLPNISERKLNKHHQALHLIDPTDMYVNKQPLQRIKLSEVRKITYRPLPDVMVGYYNLQVDFYRAVHKDTRPLASIDPLWFSVPEFTSFLENHIQMEGLHSSFEIIGSHWVPRQQLHFGYSFMHEDRSRRDREWLMSYNAKTLKFDEVSGTYKQT